MIDRWKRWARTIKRDAQALYLAARDPRVPWYAKGLAVAVAAYAASPIDLILDGKDLRRRPIERKAYWQNCSTIQDL